MTAGDSTLVRVFVRGFYPCAVAASLFVYYRGHHQPGGGFVGGLIAVVATVAYASAFGAAAAARRLPLRSVRRCALAGLALAAASGLPALCAGGAFLTHPWTKPAPDSPWPALSTVLAFDLGVYLCVWGALGGYALGFLEAVSDGEEPSA